MITRFKTEHYKSIGSMDLNLGAMNVFAGLNGTGKSNIIDAIKFLNECSESDLDTAISRRHGIDSIRQWSKFKPFNITFYFEAKSRTGQGHYECTIGSSQRNFRVTKEEGQWQHTQTISRHDEDGNPVKSRRHLKTTFSRKDSGSCEFVHYINYEEQHTDTIDLPRDELALSILRRYFFRFRGIENLAKEIESFQAYSIYPNTIRSPNSVSNEQELLSDGDNIASIFKLIQKSKRHSHLKQEIVSSLQPIMPSLNDIHVQQAGGYYVPVFRVEEKSGEKHDYNLTQVSDGTLRIFGLLTALYQPFAPQSIAIEEPEQMIHPGALRIVAEAISDSSESKQILITTHSPVLLDFFESQDIFAVQLGDAGLTEVGRIAEEQLRSIQDSLFTVGELLASEGLRTN